MKQAMLHCKEDTKQILLKTAQESIAYVGQGKVLFADMKAKYPGISDTDLKGLLIDLSLELECKIRNIS